MADALWTADMVLALLDLMETDRLLDDLSRLRCLVGTCGTTAYRDLNTAGGRRALIIPGGSSQRPVGKVI